MTAQFRSPLGANSHSPSSRSPALATDFTGHRFLRFQVSPQMTAMVAVQQLNQILSIPVAQVLPIPHLPAWVMGVYNWRGEILWLVDLAHLLGLAPITQQSLARASYRTLVIHETAPDQPTSPRNQARKRLGLVVQQVEDMEWCDPEQIQSPPNTAVTPALAPFLRGYWVKPDGTLVGVLEGQSIFARLPQSPAGG